MTTSSNSYLVAVMCLLLARISIQQDVVDDSSNVADNSTEVDEDGPGVTTGFGGVHTKVLGRSGKIVIAKTPVVTDDPNRITIDLDTLEEKSASGQSFPRKKMRFSSLEFTVSDVVETDWMNVSAKQFNASANFDNATFAMFVYVFTENKLVNLSGEELDIKSGNVKLNFEITNWAFCDDQITTDNKCQSNGHETYLDFTLNLKSKKKPTKWQKKRNRGEEFDIGNNATLILSQKVSYDGTESVDFPVGYPSFEVKGAMNIFTFRFGRFNNSVLYDPVVDLGEIQTATNSTATPTATPTRHETTLQTTKKTVSGSEAVVSVIPTCLLFLNLCFQFLFKAVFNF